LDVNSKIVVTGAAGLVGQNLIVQLKANGFNNIVAIDKHPYNTKILANLHPDIKVIFADLAEKGEWQNSFINASCVVMLQAQIGGLTIDPFIRNNINSTKLIIELMKKHNVPYLIHISSSVINSVANDFYTNTKKEQEKLVITSGIDYCVLRPTLMFGWFDRKHLGWLSRFMKKVPVFPIPGDGKYIRQPLYVKDFCNIIISVLKEKPKNKIYDITGCEKVYYVDIIRSIKKATKAKTIILHIPYSLFYFLLATAGMLMKDPPFTIQQLKALVAKDEFELIPWWDIFHVMPTKFSDAIYETFNDPVYSKYILEF